MIFKVRHITDIRYASVVRLARFNLRLKPAVWPGQTLIDYRLKVTPRPPTITEQAGPYVVNNSRIVLTEPTSRLRIESEFLVDKEPVPGSSETTGPTVGQVRADAIVRRDLSEYGPASYLFASPLVKIEPTIAIWAQDFIADDIPIIAAGTGLMEAIYSQFRFDSKATEANTPPIEAFNQRRGVCQDFAQIMIIALRAHGIPAAYVSGYLRTTPPPGQPRLIGADASHAWVNIWCGNELGWIGFDPTNNAIARGGHIFTAMGRDYSDVAPINGVFHGQAGQQLKVSVDVAPVSEPVGS